MLPPGLIFFDGDGPADPLVARERRYVFPGRQRLRVRRKRLPEISRKVMYDSFRDSNGCHRIIQQAKGSGFWYESTTRSPGLSLPILKYDRVISTRTIEFSPIREILALSQEINNLPKLFRGC
jgi:hypothetical protein